MNPFKKQVIGVVPEKYSDSVGFVGSKNPPYIVPGATTTVNLPPETIIRDFMYLLKNVVLDE